MLQYLTFVSEFSLLFLDFAGAIEPRRESLEQGFGADILVIKHNNMAYFAVRLWVRLPILIMTLGFLCLFWRLSRLLMYRLHLLSVTVSS